MKVIVQKFGGTSVQNEEGRTRAANHVKSAVKEGYKVIVVVSAMGRIGAPYATDTLLRLIEPSTISSRDKDLLIACGEIISAVLFSHTLHEMKLPSVALTGAQAGVITNDQFMNAKIINVSTNYLENVLKQYDAVIVAGFQGETENGEVTTLGRGGSDTTATAIGAALQAESVHIFTDVEGVMTADPQIVKEARTLRKITYTEISNMAYQGAKVIHPRAVEIAKQANVPIRIRSTYSNDKGTLVTGMENELGKKIHDKTITGIAHVVGVTQIKVLAKDDDFHIQQYVFKAMAQAKISVDFININPQGVVYTVMQSEAKRAVEILHNIGYEPIVTENCAKISTIGAGMTGVPGVTAKIVSTLSKQNIQILQSADSHTTIWVLVKEKDMKKAVNALHQTFQLEK